MFVLLLAGVRPGSAQQGLPLVDLFTHVWRYEESGRDWGTAWRTNNFNDSAWPVGVGLFGVETGAPFPYAPAGFPAMSVPLSLTPPGSNAQAITYYFRTHFNVAAGHLPGLVLLATNYLDDGAVIYLNGIEVARFRVPSNQNFQTTTTGLGTEGLAEVTNLPTASLRAGENVLAVEVHQSSSLSVDVAFAMSLTALVPESLVATRPPQSRTNVVGTSATFSVEINGGPVSYQWLKEGVPLVGARTNTYTIPQVQLSHAGRYSVLVSNAVSAVISAEAILTVVPDTFGPKLVSALVQETLLTNRVIVTFSERLLASTAANPAHYRVTRLATGATVPVSNALYNASPPQVQLVVGGSDWVLGENYFLTVNGVRDFTASNSIAPDSQVGIGWPQSLQVLRPDHVWDFHTAAVFDRGVFNTPWWAGNYTPGSWWAQGAGMFCGGPVLASPCFGQLQTEIGFQDEPSLFRTTFQWPGHLGLNARLRMAYAVDDGMVLYLNGAELLRFNVPAGPVHAGTLAQLSIPSMSCATQIVALANLRPGANSLAAAVCQAIPASGDTVFGLHIDALYERTSPVPASPPPALRIIAREGNTLQLSWTGAGFALESSPTLIGTNSAPLGPWTEVPDMTNPFTTPAVASQRFYRLRK